MPTELFVVEDEYPLQGLVEETLREAGFDPAILSSGEEALTLFRGKVADYRALVTDVKLKGSLSGWEVARQIREMAAGFPVVYMTGGGADQWTSHGVPDSILLQKPIAPAQLARQSRSFSTPVDRQPLSSRRPARKRIGRNIIATRPLTLWTIARRLSTAPVADSQRPNARCSKTCARADSQRRWSRSARGKNQLEKASKNPRRA